MTKQDIARIAQEFDLNSEYYYVAKENALTEELSGMKIFEEPLFAFEIHRFYICNYFKIR